TPAPGADSRTRWGFRRRNPLDFTGDDGLHGAVSQRHLPATDDLARRGRTTGLHAGWRGTKLDPRIAARGGLRAPLGRRLDIERRRRRRDLVLAGPMRRKGSPAAPSTMTGSSPVFSR